jgi:hypothetical protein
MRPWAPPALPFPCTPTVVPRRSDLKPHALLASVDLSLFGRASTGALQHTLRGHTDDVTSVAFVDPDPLTSGNPRPGAEELAGLREPGVRRELAVVDDERGADASLLAVLVVIDLEHDYGTTIRQMYSLALADIRNGEAHDRELRAGGVDQAEAEAAHLRLTRRMSCR